MSDSSSSLSRREWLGRVSVPALLAGVGAAIPSSASAVAVDTPAATPRPGGRIHDVRDYGAKGDGAALDTVAVQAAIDRCAEERGGTVLIPAGVFVVGTLELKSFVTLHLASGARLLGSPDPAQYHAGNGVPPSNGNIVLLSAADAENVTIEGNGTIDGNGAKFFNGHGDNTGPGQNSAQGYFQRPHLMVFYRCRNLRLREAFFTASAYHAVRILQCEHVIVDGIRIHNRVNKNNDGFHFNSSRFVHLTNCDVACQDDACALFGSMQFVTIINSTFSTRWSAFRFGGGEAKNITISNCVIYETYGCAIKMRCGARSRFEHIRFSNLVLRDVTGPISIGLDSTSRRGTNDTRPLTPGVIRDIVFDGIDATVVAQGRQHDDLPFRSEYRPGEMHTCITVNAVGDDVIENVRFSNMNVRFEGGGTAEEAALRDVPKIAGEYFEVGTLPAYALFARNVRGLALSNVRFETEQPDHRPAVVLDHVTDGALGSLSVQGNKDAESVLRFVATRDILLTANRVLGSASTFLQVEEAGSEAIVVDGGDTAKAAQPLAFARGATSAAVKWRG